MRFQTWGQQESATCDADGTGTCELVSQRLVHEARGDDAANESDDKAVHASDQGSVEQTV